MSKTIRELEAELVIKDLLLRKAMDALEQIGAEKKVPEMYIKSLSGHDDWVLAKATLAEIRKELGSR